MKNKKPGKISNVQPTGSFILVEMLTEQEAMATSLYIGHKVASQGYILSMGPSVEAKSWGINIGDRVLLQGTHVPVPNYREGRELSIVSPHDIKCVLSESLITSD